MTEQVWEGTWDEIKERGKDLGSRRVRLTLLAGGAEPQQMKQNGQAGLAAALNGLIGAIDSGEVSGGRLSNLSEDEDAFGRYLEAKHPEREP